MNNPKVLNAMRSKYLQSQKKKGIDFDGSKTYWSSKKNELDILKNKVENKSVSLNTPSYFTSSIHTYPNGHLNDDQSYQIDAHIQGSALLSVKSITSSNEHFTPEEAYEIYQKHLVKNIISAVNVSEVNSWTDFGSGTGNLITSVANRLIDIDFNAIDLSPNYLSIALYKYQHKKNIKWIHNNIEHTSIDKETQDVVSVCYVFHEMPESAIINTLQEAFRILKQDGTLICIDMDPGKLPKYPSFIDISEPFLQMYRNIHIDTIMKNSNFKSVHTVDLHCMSTMWVATK